MTTALSIINMTAIIMCTRLFQFFVQRTISMVNATVQSRTALTRLLVCTRRTASRFSLDRHRLRWLIVIVSVIEAITHSGNSRFFHCLGKRTIMMAGVLFNNMAAIIMSTEKAGFFSCLLKGHSRRLCLVEPHLQAFSFALTFLLGVV